MKLFGKHIVFGRPFRQYRISRLRERANLLPKDVSFQRTLPSGRTFTVNPKFILERLRNFEANSIFFVKFPSTVAHGPVKQAARKVIAIHRMLNPLEAQAFNEKKNKHFGHYLAYGMSKVAHWRQNNPTTVMFLQVALLAGVVAGLLFVPPVALLGLLVATSGLSALAVQGISFAAAAVIGFVSAPAPRFYIGKAFKAFKAIFYGPDNGGSGGTYTPPSDKNNMALPNAVAQNPVLGQNQDQSSDVPVKQSGDEVTQDGPDEDQKNSSILCKA